jgi:hypothetical protein
MTLNAATALLKRGVLGAREIDMLRARVTLFDMPVAPREFTGHGFCCYSITPPTDWAWRLLNMTPRDDYEVLELPLRTTATDERALAIRLDTARNSYNPAWEKRCGAAIACASQRSGRLAASCRKGRLVPKSAKPERRRSRRSAPRTASPRGTSSDSLNKAGMPAGSRTTSAVMISKPRRCVPSALSSGTS